MAARKPPELHPGSGRWAAQWVLPGLVFLMVMAAFVLAAFWKNVDTQRRAQFEMQRSSERIGAEVAHRFQHAARGLGSARAMLALLVPLQQAPPPSGLHRHKPCRWWPPRCTHCASGRPRWPCLRP